MCTSLVEFCRQKTCIHPIKKLPRVPYKRPEGCKKSTTLGRSHSGECDKCNKLKQEKRAKEKAKLATEVKKFKMKDQQVKKRADNKAGKKEGT